MIGCDSATPPGPGALFIEFRDGLFPLLAEGALYCPALAHPVTD